MHSPSRRVLALLALSSSLLASVARGQPDCAATGARLGPAMMHGTMDVTAAHSGSNHREPPLGQRTGACDMLAHCTVGGLATGPIAVLPAPPVAVPAGLDPSPRQLDPSRTPEPPPPRG